MVDGPASGKPCESQDHGDFAPRKNFVNAEKLFFGQEETEATETGHHQTVAWRAGLWPAAVLQHL